MYDVNILVVPNLFVHLECFMSMICVMGWSCRFCILIGGFGGSSIFIGGMIFGNGVWRKFWLGWFLIYGRSVNACWCKVEEPILDTLRF